MRDAQRKNGRHVASREKDACRLRVGKQFADNQISHLPDILHLKGGGANLILNPSLHTHDVRRKKKQIRVICAIRV